MVGGLGVLAHPIEEFIVGLHMLAGGDLLAGDLAQRRGRHEFPPLPDGGEQTTATPEQLSLALGIE